MKDIIINMCKMFKKNGIEQTENFFGKATDSQMQKLSELMGDKVNKVVDFYKEYQPINMPMFPCYLKLLDIETMIEENTNAEPGMYLAKYGVITFGVTVGGNVICVDTNNVNNGDPIVLIADSGFCYYDDDINDIAIAIIPDDVIDQFDLSEPNILDYKSIKLCLRKINDSFIDFLRKLSEGYYKDIEKFLD